MPYVERVDRNGKVVDRYYTSRFGNAKRRKQKKNAKKAAAILRRLLKDEEGIPDIEFTYENNQSTRKGAKTGCNLGKVNRA